MDYSISSPRTSFYSLLTQLPHNRQSLALCGDFCPCCGYRLGGWLSGTSTFLSYAKIELNQVTELGKFLDPLVDKLLVLGTFLALIELGFVPAWGVFLILARELAIAGWRVNPKLTGNSNISGANIWGKLKTVVQIIAIAFLIAPLSPQWETTTNIFFWLAVAFSLISGWIYILPSISSSKEKSISAS